MPETFITPHGDYRQLHAYQASEAAFDMTFHFCERFLRKGDRTIDQMVQAARSGKQNIAEGSRASGTSKEMEVKLMNIARASLEELLLDYEDYLRVRDLPMWKRDSVEATAARDIYRSDRAEQTYRVIWETRSADVIANVAICLIHQANFLLDQLIRQLERDFVHFGGIRERMTKARIDYRNTHRNEPPPQPKKPEQPKQSNRPEQPELPKQTNRSNRSDQTERTNPTDHPRSTDQTNPSDQPNRSHPTDQTDQPDKTDPTDSPRTTNPHRP